MAQWAEKNYTAACVLFIAVLLVLCILRNEHVKRKAIGNDPNLSAKSADNIYQIWLGRWSFAAMTTCLATAILYCGRYLPYVCLVSTGADQAFLYISKCMVGCYQIARLQYCFLDKQIHSKKFGYPQWVFTFLYCNAVVLSLYILVMCCFFLYDTKSFGSTGCARPLKDTWRLALWIGAPYYYLWDWTILVLYVAKIIQIHKQKNTDNSAHQVDNAVLKRCRIILQKILLLTLILELLAVTNTFILQFFVIRQFQSQWPGIIANAVLESFDIVSTCFIVYIMVDHNEAIYLRIVMQLDAMYCCICCKSLVDQKTVHDLYTVSHKKYTSSKRDDKEADHSQVTPPDKNGFDNSKGEASLKDICSLVDSDVITNLAVPQQADSDGYDSDTNTNTPIQKRVKMEHSLDIVSKSEISHTNAKSKSKITSTQL